MLGERFTQAYANEGQEASHQVRIAPIAHTLGLTTMPTTSKALLLPEFEATFAPFEAGVRALATLRTALPSGISRSASAVGETLSLNSNAFSFIDGVLLIATVPPLRIASPRLPPGKRVSHLVLRIGPTKLIAEVRVSRISPKQRNKNQNPRLHGEGAMFITKAVRPRTVRGGLPSLGKGAK
jgi:hypothetical protein